MASYSAPASFGCATGRLVAHRQWTGAGAGGLLCGDRTARTLTGPVGSVSERRSGAAGGRSPDLTASEILAFLRVGGPAMVGVLNKQVVAQFGRVAAYLLETMHPEVRLEERQSGRPDKLATAGLMQTDAGARLYAG